MHIFAQFWAFFAHILYANFSRSKFCQYYFFRFFPLCRTTSGLNDVQEGIDVLTCRRFCRVHLPLTIWTQGCLWWLQSSLSRQAKPNGKQIQLVWRQNVEKYLTLFNAEKSYHEFCQTAFSFLNYFLYPYFASWKMNNKILNY